MINKPKTHSLTNGNLRLAIRAIFECIGGGGTSVYRKGDRVVRGTSDVLISSHRCVL